MPNPSCKSTRTMYIYFAQVGTIFCDSIKNVPKAGNSFSALLVERTMKCLH
jgi:hypothetical protein